MTYFMHQRETIDQSGAWGTLYDASGVAFAKIMERTYQTPDGNWLPKIPAGQWTLTLGPHVLHSGPLQAYSYPDFPGWDGLIHTGCLIHPANWTSQLDGCQAIGDQDGTLSGQPALLQSDDAFHRLMIATAGAPQIQVTVVDPPGPQQSTT